MKLAPVLAGFALITALSSLPAAAVAAPPHAANPQRTRAILSPSPTQAVNTISCAGNWCAASTDETDGRGDRVDAVEDGDHHWFDFNPLAPREDGADAHPKAQAVSCTRPWRCAIAGHDDFGPILTLTHNDVEEGLIERVVAAPQPAGLPDGMTRPKQRYVAIDCGKPTSCAAVGVATDPGTGESRALVAVYDGTAWRAVDDVDGATALRAVSCNAQSCVALGSDGVVLTGDLGGAWHRTSPVRPADRIEASHIRLNDVDCFGTSSCGAAGSFVDGQGRTRPLFERFNGAGWRGFAAPLSATARRERSDRDMKVDFGAISCADSGVCTASGRFTDSGSPNHPQRTPFVSRLSGTAVTTEELRLPQQFGTPVGHALTDISCAVGTRCEAVGYFAVGITERLLVEAFAKGTWTPHVAPRVAGLQRTLPAGAEDPHGVRPPAVSCSKQRCVTWTKYFTREGVGRSYVIERDT
jgi:hypothetical protein